MPFYSYRGRVPAHLPSGISVRQDNGEMMWIEPMPQTQNELMKMGFMLASDPPLFDPETEIIDWMEGTWIVYPRPSQDTKEALSPLKMERLAELANTRWQQQQTFVFRGKVALSDDVTIGRLVAKLFSAQLSQTSPLATSLWKFGPDNFAAVTTGDLIAYGAAMNAHVQGCFDYEAELTRRINQAATQSALLSINIQTGWPN